jgi:hypothetical protein
VKPRQTEKRKMLNNSRRQSKHSVLKMKRLIVLMALLITGGAIDRAAACSCDEATTAVYFKTASAVFIGTVTAKRKSNAAEKDGVEVTLKVERVWKGNVSNSALVYTGATSDLYPFENLCAPRFRIGQRYIVFALGQDKLETDICAGTLDFRHGQSVLKQLGRSRPPRRL